MTEVQQRVGCGSKCSAAPLHRYKIGVWDQAAPAPVLGPKLLGGSREAPGDVSGLWLSSGSQIHFSHRGYLKGLASMSLVELAELTVVNKLCKLLSTLPSAHKSFGNPSSPPSAYLFLRNVCQSFCVKFLPSGCFQTAPLPSTPFPHHCLLFSGCKVLPSHMRQFPPL